MRRGAFHCLIVPGWHGSPDDHWQSHWQRALPNCRRIEQADWMQPQRPDWVTELDRGIAAASAPVLLIAHSLGCPTVAHWVAQASPEALRRVRGVLLVAPADVERPGCPEPLRNFAPLPLVPLPFPSVLVGSDNDPAASADRACAMGKAWGSEVTVLTGVGHINVESGHHRWEEGLAFLQRLQALIGEQAQRRA
ncbi:RBBP9/YdeN family alpha/beta hydrolase [Stutzerimonas stutzeri]|uniref:RBBP9/YdeN family alpha/beta hydrolase n=1 Tax=Stutzerimonas stutzeri TaxID=316 RepID=UPI00210CE2E5|nr:alpha/beta hydrolase [Stutzerimonas stutzeri]MCQ4322156.1 alpha/beta hydrolase [Stutzerimonas stutzeri]